MIISKNGPSGYTPSEMMVCTLANEIKDGDRVLAGVGIPCLGIMVAKLCHAPNALVAVESGSIGAEPRRLMLGIGDNACVENTLCDTSLWRTFSDLQRGFFDIGVIGGAQIDKYGNVNSTIIFGEGNYSNPKICLPGSGGASDLATSSQKLIIVIKLVRRSFVENVDYITSPGYLSGRNHRESLKLPGGGPFLVITDKCTFSFDRFGEMHLRSIYPGVQVEDIKQEVGWELKVSPKLEKVVPPTKQYLRIIRQLDKGGIYTGDGLKNMDFSQYCRIIKGYRKLRLPSIRYVE